MRAALATAKRSKRAASELIWYLAYYSIVALLFGSIVFISNGMFRTHTDTAPLHTELTYEHTILALLAPSPYTGTRTQLRDNIDERIAQLSQRDDTYAVKVVTGNTTHYSNQELYERMTETIGTKHDFHRVKLLVAGTPADISIVVNK